MVRTTLLSLLVILSMNASAKAKDNCIVVTAGDAQSLLSAIDQANIQNADTMSQRLYIIIPNGIYNLGDRTLTAISGHNIALIGESMEGVVIVNAPAKENEGISKTATLLNHGWHTYVQDLTLKNGLDYYGAKSAGRAVCWQDKGNFTILKRVRMLSYQDTYYSNSETCQHYFEDSEIHGTVDFICGAGDVFFNRCLIVTEKRNPDGSGRNVIAAPRTSVTEWGYVFDHCTIRNDVSAFQYARAWHTKPRCAWLYTRLETPEKLLPTRYDPNGLREVHNLFYEYGTTDAQGRDITPRSNIVTFVCKGDSNTVETIITADEARRFQLKKVFPKWRPDKVVRRLEREALKMKRQGGL